MGWLALVRKSVQSITAAVCLSSAQILVNETPVEAGRMSNRSARMMTVTPSQHDACGKKNRIDRQEISPELVYLGVSGEAGIQI